MTNQARRKMLRALGYTEAPMCFTRGAESWDGPNGSVLTFPKAGKAGKPFTIIRGAVNLISALMHVGNTAASVKAMLTSLYDAGDDMGWTHDGFFNVPDPSRADYASPEWTDELFCAVAKINANYVAQDEAESARSNAQVN